MESLLWKKQRKSQKMLVWTYTIRSKASSQSVLRTLAGHTSQVQQSQSKKAVQKLLKQQLAIGEGLQAFCIPGSVADQRKVGLGHGNLGKMLLEEIQNVLHSWQVMSLSQQLKVLLVSLKKQTKYVRNLCVLS